MDQIDSALKRIEAKLDRLKVRFEKLRAERDELREQLKAALADAERERLACGVTGNALNAAMREIEQLRGSK